MAWAQVTLVFAFSLCKSHLTKRRKFSKFKENPQRHLLSSFRDICGFEIDEGDIPECQGGGKPLGRGAVGQRHQWHTQKLKRVPLSPQIDPNRLRRFAQTSLVTFAPNLSITQQNVSSPRTLLWCPNLSGQRFTSSSQNPNYSFPFNIESFTFFVTKKTLQEMLTTSLSSNERAHNSVALTTSCSRDWSMTTTWFATWRSTSSRQWISRWSLRIILPIASPLF